MDATFASFIDKQLTIIDRHKENILKGGTEITDFRWEKARKGTK